MEGCNGETGLISSAVLIEIDVESLTSATLSNSKHKIFRDWLPSTSVAKSRVSRCPPPARKSPLLPELQSSLLDVVA